MSDQRRIERLVILVSADEKDLVSREAASAGMPVSAFVRSRLFDGTPGTSRQSAGTPSLPPEKSASPDGDIERRVQQLMAQGDTSVLARKKAEEEHGIPS